MKVLLTAATLIVLNSAALFAATRDEIALKTRASQFYTFQMEGKRAQAAEIVEPRTRDLFLSGRRVPYSAYKIGRVLVTGPETAEVEVTVELTLEMFPQPVSRMLSTNWKKIEGKWYFAVDTSAIEAIRSRMPALPQEPQSPLSFKPTVVFGQDSEIHKSLRLQNNSSGILEFRIAGFDDQWFDIKNRSGVIPGGEYFPLMITLRQMPEGGQKQVIMVEGVLPDKQIYRLEIPVMIEAPAPAVAKLMREAIREYRKEH